MNSKQKSYNLGDLIAERVGFKEDLVLSEPINQFALFEFSFLEVRDWFGGFEDTSDHNLILVGRVVGAGMDEEKLFKFILSGRKGIVVWMKEHLSVKSYYG